MARGKAVAIDLTETERGELDALRRRHGTAQALALRARIVLLAAAGLSNSAIAEGLGIDKHTAGKWRNRFAAARLDGLHDEPAGAPRQIGDDAIAETIRMTLESRPAGATHGSLRAMARATGYAPSTIHRIWQAFGLQPYRQATFKLASDPMFVEKVRDIVGLYLISIRRTGRWCCAFDGGDNSSDAGGLLLGATDRAIGLVGRFAACFADGHAQAQVEHTIEAMVAQRVFGIALGYEDVGRP